MPTSIPTFAELLAKTSHHALHLEMRDVYGVESEDSAFAEWKRGGSRDFSDRSSWWSGFHQTVADGVSRGVQVRRARVVSEPVSEYIRFEHAGTVKNLAAGEEVRWLPRSRASDLLLPGNDVWIFDNYALKYGLFDGDGRHVGGQMVYDPEAVDRCLTAFNAVWERATPHSEYEL
ncbi:DUF6879 family protein [Streptomyces sp. NPDC059355]|uniref:DUF6879 family protein n=1 Tax=Streptomyces sp. NPDC059355 TaxID=3346811 RepID=UPI0036D1BB6B